ncbi:FAD-dependent oxidoreductase [Fictibacillus phosphorivorans]|uniref:FAD-dependent oxidoreductase n=1 Tax=Fictibacillus phosphorivorans TaxID=1221500 RepID=UPI0020425C6C|nr:FAD-dependent oxidoreductase [Fictibacillus phosphorivorans]MCM3718481.1 FAD-dependent oxidoreductase [Fictibacillus phosphorivorans]MCM3776163.1 FAD-dependent oxidoreductase [Fictibacillus phosphorivorans]
MKDKKWVKRTKAAAILFIIVVIVIGIKKLYPYSTTVSKSDIEPYVAPDIQEQYDVIVVGGEPEGVAAAVSAAKNGSKTLLIEHRDGLGGLFTYGALNFLDVSEDIKGSWANQGIFLEWLKLTGSKIGFDLTVAEMAFMKLVQDEEQNLTLSLNTQLNDVVVEGNTLTGIVLTDEKGQKKTVKAKRFIDSTQDADLAVAANAPFFKGGADIGLEDRKMAVTLMMHFSNIDWDAVQDAAKEDVFGGGETTSNVAWGFSKLHYDYKPVNPQTRLRGLNMVRQKDGSVYINALQIFGIDGLDPVQKQKAIKIGKAETKHVLKYLQKEFPGFQNAKIESFPPELYVRETRHIKTEYQLPMTDIWENNDHWDSIGFGSYPVDVQATSPGDYGYIISKPEQYAIPFRSLIPLKVDNLLIASKAAGYSSIAAGSARVVPIGMTVGEAAGAAAAVSIENETPFREMSKNKKLVKTLQNVLKDQNANLYTFDLDYPYKGEWFYDNLKPLINHGLIVGGYANEFPVDKPFTEMTFSNLLTNGIHRMVPDRASQYKMKEMRNYIGGEKKVLTGQHAARMLLALDGVNVPKEKAWETAIEKGFIDKTLQNKINPEDELKGSEGYYLVGHVLNKIENIEQ